MKIHRLSSYDPARQRNNFDIILYSQGAGGPDYCGPTDMQYLNLAYNGGPVDWGVVGGRLRMERGRWGLLPYPKRMTWRTTRSWEPSG